MLRVEMSNFALLFHSIPAATRKAGIAHLSWEFVGLRTRLPDHLLQITANCRSGETPKGRRKGYPYKRSGPVLSRGRIRLSFDQLADAHRCIARHELDLPPTGDVPTMIAREVDRLAIRRARPERGKLIIRSTSNAPRIPRRKLEVVL